MESIEFINRCLVGNEYEHNDGRDYPILISIQYFFRRNTSQHCWCPQCKEFHGHGNGKGHRQAHCYRNDKYKGMGYCIYPSGYKFKDNSDALIKKCSRILKKTPDIRLLIEQGLVVVGS